MPRAGYPSRPSLIALILLGLTAATIVVYWPLRQNQFINYDDQQYVYDNPEVNRGISAPGLLWAFRTGHAANYHPLTWLSHQLDVQLFGLNPAAHHLVGLGFHIINSWLVFALFLRLTGAIWPSVAVAALFALHPLHVESVAWASERKDLLSSLFGLLTLLTYERYARMVPDGAEAQNLPTNWWQRASFVYGSSVGLFACGLLAKPMLVSLPFVMMLLDYWPLQRSPPGSAVTRSLMEKAPFLALAALSCLLTLLVQERAMVFYKSLPFEYRVINAIIAYARYLGLTIWPQKLAVIYPHPGSWPASLVILALAVLVVITGIAVWQRRRKPYLLVGWLWFVGMLVPVIGLVQVGSQAMADRYTYLPLLGIFLMVTWAAVDWIGTSSARLKIASLAGGMVICFCGIRAHQEVRHWKDTESIFTRALAVTQGNWVAHHNLALLALSRYDDIRKATVTGQLAQPAAVPEPGHKYLAEVVAHCQAALAAKPRLGEVHVTLAKAYTEQGLLDEARAHLELATRADRRNPAAHQYLADVLHRQGRVADAVVEYRSALELQPDWHEVLNNLAWVLATHPDSNLRDGSNAVALATQACNLTARTNLWYLHTLAAAYAESGDFSNAISTAAAVLRMTAPLQQAELTRKAEERLRLYKSGEPLRDSPTK